MCMSLHNINVLWEICKRKFNLRQQVEIPECNHYISMLCFAQWTVCHSPCLTRCTAQKIDMLMPKVGWLYGYYSLEHSSKTISLAYIKLLCMCTCACVQIWETEEERSFGVAVAHFFFSFCSEFPLSLRCCQSPWGRISAATIGRPRLSKYTF